MEDDGLSQFREKKGTRLNLAQTDVNYAFIWYDYFSVPQKAGGPAVGKHEEQLKYTQSIPYYVDSCQVFVALTPNLKNEDGETCDYSCWLSRGWCRMEMWCKQLSTMSDIPVIVIPNSREAHFARPQWLHYPVDRGKFTVESDSIHCCQVIEKSVDNKLSILRFKDMNQFRFYTASKERMSGLPPKQRNWEEFWHDFALVPGVFKQKGLGPLECATLAEDSQMIRNLVAARASLESRAPNMTKLEVLKGQRPLHLATTFARDSLQTMKTLLELRANPNSRPAMTHAPLARCGSASAVELLVRYRADVNGKSRIG